MAELRTIALSDIDEPPIAIRLTMNDSLLDDLAVSIREVGLQNPITVVEESGRFRIVTGHRRFIAHQKINAHEILCLVRQPGEIQEIAAMVAENICREDVNAAEEAIFYARLVEECGYSESDLMQLTRRSAQYIGDRFSLLRGDPTVFAALQNGSIAFATARELNRCHDEEMRRFYLDNAVRGGHACRIVKRWIDDWNQNQVQRQQTLEAPPAPTEEPKPDAPEFCCALCGGYRDPWNFIDIRLHKMEWDAIQRSLREGANEATSAD